MVAGAAGVALAAGFVLAGCSPRGTGRTEAVAQARAEALIASGNAALTAGDDDLAARRYAAATVAAPGDPAAWFGLGIALSRLGRDDEARAAYAKAKELSGSTPPR
jgi:Flp pilus assembly protein TadD